jgi:large subunit ribosomal protein L18
VFIFKSNRHLYAQAINDDLSAVVACASTLEKEFREKSKNSKNKEASENLGQVLARRLKEKKIDRIVFDRGTYPYHGRVKTLAGSLRKGGLAF